MRLFNDDADEYRSIANSWLLAKGAMRYDVSTQVELSVLPGAKLAFEYAILITNKVCELLPLATSPSAGARDESARLGHYDAQLADAEQSFNAVLEWMSN